MFDILYYYSVRKLMFYTVTSGFFYTIILYVNTILTEHVCGAFKQQ